MAQASEGVQAAAVLSRAPHAAAAADEAATRLAEALGGVEPTLVLVFVTHHHALSLGRVGERLREATNASLVAGCSAAGVVSNTREIEGAPGVAVLGLRVPDAAVSTFTDSDLGAALAGETTPEDLAEAMGLEPRHRLIITLADPFSTPLIRLVPALAGGVAEAGGGAPLIGGVASSSGESGGNRLLLLTKERERLQHSGLVGLALAGRFKVDTVVSQGCRPIGEPLVVTRSRNNLVLELAGRPALEVVTEVCNTLGGVDRKLLTEGLFLGRVVDERKSRFGRGDFLIRPLIAADEASGALAVGDFIPTGRTVQVHLRDAQAAHEDLALLLDGQKLYGPPAAGLLITCTGRGRRFFGHPDHDARVVQNAFAHAAPGHEAAKPGSVAGDDTAAFPLAGFFAGGEIGPIGDTSYLHGHTASLALLREADDAG